MRGMMMMMILINKVVWVWLYVKGKDLEGIRGEECFERVEVYRLVMIYEFDVYLVVLCRSGNILEKYSILCFFLFFGYFYCFFFGFEDYYWWRRREEERFWFFVFYWVFYYWLSRYLFDVELGVCFGNVGYLYLEG